MSLDHSLGSSSHCNRQDHDKGGWDHTQTCSDSVDDDFLLAGEVIGGEDNDRTDNSNPKQEHCETRQFLLERCSNVDSEEAANVVGRSQTPSLSISVWSSFSFIISLDGSDLWRYQYASEVNSAEDSLFIPCCSLLGEQQQWSQSRCAIR